MSYVFPPSNRPCVAVRGTSARFPVHRIYCVGRNYAAHVREMGKDPAREPPFFFLKPADAVVPSGHSVRYPPRTQNLHHEIELVVALHGEGRNVGTREASRLIYGYAVGIDLTRRDLQIAAREAGRPWDIGKTFEECAPVTSIHPVAEVGYIEKGRIWLTVNGELRQEGDVSALIWDVPELIAELSALFTLRPGDLIFTGTPAGVGPVQRGDLLEGGIDGLDERLVTTIA